MVLRRRTNKTQVAVIVGSDAAGAGRAPSAIRPSNPSGASNCSYRFLDGFIERADRLRAEPFTNVNEQVEPLQAQALKQVNLQVRKQGLGFDGERAGVRVERQLNLGRQAIG